MASHELIDAQFDRAVEIVQGLPKTGPIQTDYEEKLQMYSLYKQATVGNVKSPRPGMWDMLGRAKWDAWAKHKDLDAHEAKWLYVDALLKVLRRYSDKTIAQNLVQELESYGGDPSNLVLSRTSMQSPSSDSSGSTASRDPPYQHIAQQPLGHKYTSGQDDSTDEDEGEEDVEDDQAVELPTVSAGSLHGHGQMSPRRPQSSLSAQRYQTSITGAMLSPPPRGSIQSVPATQPLPAFETPSAFPASPSSPGSVYQPLGPPFAPLQYDPTRPEPNSRQNIYPGYRTYPQQPTPLQPHGSIRSVSRATLENAIENVQAHLAALTERLETLEARSLRHSSSSSARGASLFGPPHMYDNSSGSGRHPGRGSPRPTWDLDDLGMWSYVLNPISHVIRMLHKLARFFARDESRSPTKVIVRRLCLDLSFLACVVLIISAVWRKSGVRRNEVRAALVALWHAIAGGRRTGHVKDRGV